MIIASFLKDISRLITISHEESPPEQHYFQNTEAYHKDPVKVDVILFFIPEGETRVITPQITEIYKVIEIAKPAVQQLIRPHRDQRARNNARLLQEKQIHLSTCSFGLPFKQNYLIFSNIQVPDKRCSGECRFSDNYLHDMRHWNTTAFLLSNPQLNLMKKQRGVAKQPMIGAILYYLLSYVPCDEKILIESK